VAGALPPALFNLGADIRICLPFYGFIDVKKYKIKKIKNTPVDIAGHKEKIEIWQTVLPDTLVKVYLIKHDFFNANKIYFGARIYKNKKFTRTQFDIKRFAFFTKTALTACRELDFRPDVVHANDWHTALAGDFIKTFNKSSNFFAKTKTLYTIHNLANQGLAEPAIVKFAELDAGLPPIKKDLLNNDLNLMVQGILASGMVNTVSPSYAKEMLTGELGAGLERITKIRKKDIYGILNGIDTDFYDPQKDKLIFKNYSTANLALKKENKKYLEKKLGFKADKSPIASIVSRLVWQKGMDLITKKIFELPIRLVILGTGDKQIENNLKILAQKYPDKMKLILKFDEQLAHQIYAGSDIFLMPSRYEPCGLGQMIAMRYGTVPIVRATGGLKDTVDNKVGFKFNNFSENNLYIAVEQCLKAYSHPEKWQKLAINGMNRNFSWSKSARKYMKLYNKLLNSK